jgi:hypothetical protein
MSSSIIPSSLLSKTNPAALGAAAKAMGELCVSGCIGAGCVSQKLVTPEMLRILSRTIYTLLLPFFIGTNLLQTVGGGSSSSLRPSSLGVPLMAIIQSTILFMLASKIIIPLFGLDAESDEGKVLSTVCCFGNAGVLPFVFVEAMFRNNIDLLQRAYSQTSFFSAGWSPFFWSFVPKVMQISQTPTTATCNDSIMARYWQNCKVFFPPPVMGVVVGVLIGLSPLSSLLLSRNPQQYPAPLAIVYNSFQNLGKCASPLAVLVLTCSLAFGAGKRIEVVKTATTNNNNVMRKWACVSFTRFIISPLIMSGLLYGMSTIGLIGTKTDEPMVWFVCLLESIMPPAQNSVVLLQVAGRSDEASQMAKFLFSIYTTAMIPIVALITISLESLGITP